jgi:hypothetical protein
VKQVSNKRLILMQLRQLCNHSRVEFVGLPRPEVDQRDEAATPLCLFLMCGQPGTGHAAIASGSRSPGTRCRFWWADPWCRSRVLSYLGLSRRPKSSRISRPRRGAVQNTASTPWHAGLSINEPRAIFFWFGLSLRSLPRTGLLIKPASPSSRKAVSHCRTGGVHIEELAGVQIVNSAHVLNLNEMIHLAEGAVGELLPSRACASQRSRQ